MKRIKNAVFLFIFFAAGIVSAVPAVLYASEDFSRFNEMYRGEQYEEAYKGYAAGLAKDRNNPGLWYNAGNTLYRLNRPGDAVYAYAKAFSLAPRDGDIRFNLEYAMRQTGQAFIPEGTPRALYLMFYMFSDQELKALAAVFFWIAMLSACAATAFSDRVRRYSVRVSVIAFMVLMFSGGWIWARHYSQFSSSAAVITETGGLKLLSGPGENFRECASAPEGRIVRILSSSDDRYYEIGLAAEGISGWALKSGVKKL